MTRNANKKTLLAEVKKSYSRRSQWDRGVYEYAREIVEHTAPKPLGTVRYRSGRVWPLGYPQGPILQTDAAKFLEIIPCSTLSRFGRRPSQQSTRIQPRA